MKQELQDINGVSDVTHIQSNHGITSVDFKIFDLDRYTNTSNVVYNAAGNDFKGALIRLPRIHKESVNKGELRRYLESFVPSFIHSHEEFEIRLDPEVDLDDSYYYLHIKTPSDSSEDTLNIIANISKSYNTTKFE